MCPFAAEAKWFLIYILRVSQIQRNLELAPRGHSRDWKPKAWAALWMGKTLVGMFQ
jgi:hypothetical protein